MTFRILVLLFNPNNRKYIIFANLTIRALLAPRHLLFLPKGPKGPSVHPVTYYPRKSRPIGRPFFSFLKYFLTQFLKQKK